MPDTRSARVTITNKYGLHARPATDFVTIAQGFKSEVQVRCNDSEADGKSIMELMMLAATNGTEIEIRCVGEDAEPCLSRLVALVSRGFDEED